MPRSFLVKKYFAKQKPNYSELECQNGELWSFVFKDFELWKRFLHKYANLIYNSHLFS